MAVLEPMYLKLPATPEEWIKISKEFHEKWQFPALGAIDGKHVEIRPPKGSGSLYFNYKKRNSIVLMAVVDANYRFTYVSAGANGRASDGGIWSRSQFGKDLEDGKVPLPGFYQLPNSNLRLPLCFIGDDAFPLRPHIMKPYSHLNLNAEEEHFNYRISRARVVVENAFGILTNRFKIFHRAIDLHPRKIMTLIKATACLHNYLITKNHREYVQFANPPAAQSVFMRNLTPQHELPDNDAKNIRESYKHYVNNESRLD